MQSAAEGSNSGTSICRLALAVLRIPLVLLQLASTDAPQPSLLPTLPLPLLEIICQHLSRADLWALLRCCKEVWQQLHDHPLIWGDLYVKLDGGPTTATILTAIFGRQRAVGKLHIAVMQSTHLPQLSSLPCSWLTELTLSKATVIGTLFQLPQVPNVWRLALIDCNLPAGVFAYVLESNVPALANLEVLRATCERSPLIAAFKDLDGLTALNRLRLGSCNLLTVPLELSGLRALRELHADGEGGRGHWPALGLGRLSHLSGLTLLSLASCSLAMIPRELSTLVSLQSLDVSGNVFRSTRLSLESLRHLTRLSSLNLACCRMAALPRYLSTLPSLSHLDLSYNPFQGDPGRRFAMLEPNLHGFAALTYLGLRGCRLTQLPSSITSLTTLKLDLGEPY